MKRSLQNQLLVLLWILCILVSSCNKEADSPDDDQPGGTTSYTITTLAGNSLDGGQRDGTGTAARFNQPGYLMIDGNGLYLNDYSAVRRITFNGQVTTVAGNFNGGYKDGPVAAAEFNHLTGIAKNAQGVMYVGDWQNNVIRTISTDGQVRTLPGYGPWGQEEGTPGASSLCFPGDLVFDKAGNLYIADVNHRRIRKITPNGQITTFAGNGQYGFKDGVGTQAEIYRVDAMAIDGADNLYIIDRYCIRKITPDGRVTTLAGDGYQQEFQDGTGEDARFRFPKDLVVAPNGTIYVLEDGSLRTVDQAGKVTTIIGANSTSIDAIDGNQDVANIGLAVSLTMDTNGDIYFVDGFSIRKITFN